jgi:Arm DNA-binding domain
MGKLTDIAIRKLAPKDAIYNHADGDGLSVEVWPNGALYWRFRYQFAGRPKRLSMGVYSEVSLKEARNLVAEARAALRQGRNPSTERKASKRSLIATDDRTFTRVSADWLAHHKDGWAKGRS